MLHFSRSRTRPSVAFARRATVILSLLSFLGSSLPVQVFAATETVSRGSFLRSAVTTLHLNLATEGTIPYTDVPEAFLPYVRTAGQHGALAVFNASTTIDLQRAITRGEAIAVLAGLLDATPRVALAKDFKDVNTQIQRDAVAIALERHWMRPLRGLTFGWSRTLRPADERMLLRRVTQTLGVTVLPPDAQTIRVNVGDREAFPKEEILRTVWDLLKQQYLYNDRIKSEEAGYGSVEGLVNSLDDPYTVFFKPSSSKDFQTQLQGEVTGIGAQVEQKAGVLTIVAPLAGSPAEKAGLKPGDEILSVNGESLDGLSYEDAVAKVRGPKGSTATLHIRRNGDDMEVSVVRDTIRIDDFTVTMTNNDVAIVKLQQFGQLTNNEFRSKMKEVAGKGPRGIILDMRNNPGGLLDAAGIVTSAFLPERSTYVQILTKDDTTEEHTLDAPVVPASIPLVVLINKGSASAAEIVAGALQDAGRATLVGETTFGKGTVQQLLEFNDGSSLKMTIAEWHTPKGREIDGVGVKPDLEVVNSESGDEQMDRALGLIH